MAVQNPGIGSEAEVGGGGLRNIAIVAGLGALVVAAYWKALTWQPPSTSEEGAVVDLLFEPAHTSPPLAFGLAVALLFGRRARLARAMGEPGRPVAGGAVLAVAIVLHGWSIYTSTLAPQLLSAIAMALGGALFLAGPAMVRAVLRPVLVLAFAVPLPTLLVNHILWPLQLGTAVASTTILELLGVDTFRHAEMLFTREMAFQVIESCSGFRSILTLTMTAVAYSELFGRHGRRATALILLAPLIAFGLNAIRVVSIVLTTNPGGELGTFGEDHSTQGLVAIVAGVVALHLVDTALGRWRSAEAPESRPEMRHPGGGYASAPLFRTSTLGAILVGMVAVANIIEPWQPPVGRPLWGLTLPRTVLGFESEHYRPEKHHLGSVHFERTLTRAYQVDGERVEIFLGWDDRTARQGTPFSPRFGLPRSGAELLQDRRLQLDGFDVPVRSVLVRSVSGYVLAFSWYDGESSFGIEVVREFLGLDRSPLGEGRGITAVRLATPVPHPQSRDLEEAKGRLERFAHWLRPRVEAAAERSSR